MGSWIPCLPMYASCSLSAWWVTAFKLIPISSIITLYLVSLGGTGVEYWNKDYFF